MKRGDLGGLPPMGICQQRPEVELPALSAAIPSCVKETSKCLVVGSACEPSRREREGIRQDREVHKDQ